MSRTICFCHRYSETDIREDVRRHGGRSLILERIVSEKEKGACRCATEHPEAR